jgi:hypothetical protein
MGFSGYFKAQKPEEKKRPAPAVALPPIEKVSPRLENPSDDFQLQAPTPPFAAPRSSISGRSTRSEGSSVFMDDIKHEVMVNYLYQQQCSHLWVSNGSGEVEGVLVRKAKGHYVACPLQLEDSSFAYAAAALNLPVC